MRLSAERKEPAQMVKGKQDRFKNFYKQKRCFQGIVLEWSRKLDLFLVKPAELFLDKICRLNALLHKLSYAHERGSMYANSHKAMSYAHSLKKLS